MNPAPKETSPLRVLVAKPGLDGHDRGAKVVAHTLRDAGMEVIYSGLHQSVEAIVAMAQQEAVDVIGLSIMSGAHLPICRKLRGLLDRSGMSEVAVVVGGVIPQQDFAALGELGVEGIAPGGTPLQELPDIVRRAAQSREGA